MKITLILDVPKIKTVKGGQEFATILAEHIVETFNDDTSIKSVLTSVPKERAS
jgi:hypothetical protein